MRAKRVNENIAFERGKDPKKTIGVGLDCKRYVKSQLEKKGFGNPVERRDSGNLFGTGFEDMSADEMASHVIYILDSGDTESMINYMNMELDNFYQFKEETDEDE